MRSEFCTPRFARAEQSGGEIALILEDAYDGQCRASRINVTYLLASPRSALVEGAPVRIVEPHPANARHASAP